MATRSLSAGEVMLIRHGEMEWSLCGRHTGNTDIPLTARGEQGAQALAPLLEDLGVELVLVSPLQRARRICELPDLAEGAMIEPDLREWNYGAYVGLTSAEIHREAPGWRVFWDGCPVGESPAQIGERADRVIQRVRAHGGKVAVFAHSHMLRVLAARWLGLTPSQSSHFLLDTATLSILSSFRGEPALGCWNAAAL